MVLSFVQRDAAQMFGMWEWDSGGGRYLARGIEVPRGQGMGRVPIMMSSRGARRWGQCRSR